MRWSALLALAMNAVAATLFLPVAFFSSQGGGSSLTVLVVFPIYLAIYLLGVAAVIYFLSGLSRLHSSRDEYGPEHGRNLEIAVIFVVVAFVMFVSASGFGLFLIFAPASAGLGPLLVSVVMAGARGLFVGLAFLVAVRTLVPPEDRSLGLYAALILAAGPAVGVGVLLLALGELSAFVTGFLVTATEGAVELTGYVLLYRLYTVALNRLRSGELLPMYRPTPTYVSPYGVPPMYWPPGYPPWSPPPAQPQQEPPEKPAEPPGGG